MAKAKLTDPELGSFWRETFGTDEIVLISAKPTRADLPTAGVQWVYYLDLERWDLAQIRKLISALADRFQAPAEELTRFVDEYGFPILVYFVKIG